MKNLKILKKLVSLGIFAFAFSAFSVNAFAVQADADSTTAAIEFTAGQLTLASAPSFDFGRNAILGATVDYSPTGAGNNGALSVFDLRGSGVAGTGTTSTAPVTQTTVVLPSDGTAAAIESASALTGQGVWNTTWSAPTLKVLGGTAQTGQNTASIDWTLADAP